LYAGLLKLVIRFRRKKHVFLYDLDDAIYEEMDDDRQIRWFMRNVHTVITGSEELCRYARNHNEEVRLVTTPVVPTDLRFCPNGSDTLVLGFIGCYWGTHFRNMHELVMPVLKRLEFPVVLEIIGAREQAERGETVAFFRDSNVTVRFLEIDDWNDENEINRAMLGWHLGLAPLKDTVVCRAKSAFKVKQYLNLGIPCVSTKVGENPRFIVHGKNGFLFGNDEELKTVLETVYHASSEERERLSEQALVSSEQFRLPVIADYWISVLAHL
jgi:glycosyltransferase involved in cell wall biosynthesis